PWAARRGGQAPVPIAADSAGPVGENDRVAQRPPPAQLCDGLGERRQPRWRLQPGDAEVTAVDHGRVPFGPLVKLTPELVRDRIPERIPQLVIELVPEPVRELIPELVLELVGVPVPERARELRPALAQEVVPALVSQPPSKLDSELVPEPQIPELLNPELVLGLAEELVPGLVRELVGEVAPDVVPEFAQEPARKRDPGLALGLVVELAEGGGCEEATQRRVHPHHDARRRQAGRLVGAAHGGLGGGP